jgi:hypothetical protein
MSVPHFTELQVQNGTDEGFDPVNKDASIQSSCPSYLVQCLEYSRLVSIRAQSDMILDTDHIELKCPFEGNRAISQNFGKFFAEVVTCTNHQAGVEETDLPVEFVELAIYSMNTRKSHVFFCYLGFSRGLLDDRVEGIIKGMRQQ